MIHSGYLFGGTSAPHTPAGQAFPAQRMQGFPTGIGGATRFHFGPHLRIGSEGYNSTLKYGPYDSYTQIGWGGVLADWYWDKGLVSPFVGITFGGGGVKNTTFTAPTEDDFVTEAVSFRKYGFATAVPFIGLELAVTQKMLLTFKADYMLCLSRRKPDFVSGPRLYIGFTFSRPSESERSGRMLRDRNTPVRNVRR